MNRETVGRIMLVLAALAVIVALVAAGGWIALLVIAGGVVGVAWIVTAVNLMTGNPINPWGGK